MKKTSPFAFAGIVGIAIGLFAPAWSKDLTSESITFLPKPDPIASTPGSYKLDEAATINYYDGLFHGRTASEIIEFLEANGYHIIFDSRDAISFVAKERIMTFYSYKVSISLKFSKGVFQKSHIKFHGII